MLQPTVVKIVAYFRYNMAVRIFLKDHPYRYFLFFVFPPLYLVQVGVQPTLASPNGNYYRCNAENLARDTRPYCLFELTSSAPSIWNGQAVEHSLVAAGRTPAISGSPPRLGIKNRFTNAVRTSNVSPAPFTNGEDLVILPAESAEGVTFAEASEEEVSGGVSQRRALWHYQLIFELVAPLRNELMYHQDVLRENSTRWEEITRVFTDCGVKTQDGRRLSVGGGRWRSKRQPRTPLSSLSRRTTSFRTLRSLPDQSTQTIHAALLDITKIAHPSKHHTFLRFLEEGVIDVVCLAVPSFGESFQRCIDIRAGISNWETDKGCNCWFAAYEGLYGLVPQVVGANFKACEMIGAGGNAGGNGGENAGGGADVLVGTTTPMPKKDISAAFPGFVAHVVVSFSVLLSVAACSGVLYAVFRKMFGAVWSWLNESMLVQREQ